MRSADSPKPVSFICSLALLTIVGCNSDKPPETSNPPPKIMFPQTTETTIVDPAHPPQPGATVKSVYSDRLYGKTEVRSDDYIRHADSVSPTGWTPWHHRAAPHNWPEPMMTYESSVNGSWTARVLAVDVANRLITLQGPSGRSETFSVGPRVERLNEARAGDNFTLSWTATLYGELRPPTAEEAANPIDIYELVNRASSDAAPAAGKGMALRVVTTIDAVDPAAMTVTLKGPLGNKITVRGKNPENVKKLRVGDSVIVSYSQGVVVSLTKSP